MMAQKGWATVVSWIAPLEISPPPQVRIAFHVLGKGSLILPVKFRSLSFLFIYLLVFYFLLPLYLDHNLFEYVKLDSFHNL